MLSLVVRGLEVISSCFRPLSVTEMFRSLTISQQGKSPAIHSQSLIFEVTGEKTIDSRLKRSNLD